MGILGILVIWSIGTMMALFGFRAVTSARKFALEVRTERRRVEARMEALEGNAEAIRRDAEIQVRALGNIAVEARMILERARATTQISPTMEGEQLRRMLETKRDKGFSDSSPSAQESEGFVNAAVEDNHPSIRSLFS